MSQPGEEAREALRQQRHHLLGRVRPARRAGSGSARAPRRHRRPGEVLAPGPGSWSCDRRSGWRAARRARRSDGRSRASPTAASMRAAVANASQVSRRKSSTALSPGTRRLERAKPRAPASAMSAGHVVARAAAARAPCRRRTPARPRRPRPARAAPGSAAAPRGSAPRRRAGARWCAARAWIASPRSRSRRACRAAPRR